MSLSHEDVVTEILSKREILDSTSFDDAKMFASSPIYDLTHFLKTAKAEPSRWGDKYIFVR